MTSTPEQLVREDGYKWGFYDEEEALFKANKGLTPEIVSTISEMKDEPQWMRDFRLNALERFNEMENPPWGTDLLDTIDFDNIHYFVRATDRDERSWDDVPDYIRDTFDKLGIPEAEKKYLAGVGAQYDSEVVYHNIRLSIGLTYVPGLNR